jgi:hypothetical protein
MKFSRLGKSTLSMAIAVTLSSYGTMSNIPQASGVYDMRPKNSFRGGSVGKGGKIKYRRT